MRTLPVGLVVSGVVTRTVTLGRVVREILFVVLSLTLGAPLVTFVVVAALVRSVAEPPVGTQRTWTLPRALVRGTLTNRAPRCMPLRAHVGAVPALRRPVLPVRAGTSGLR